MCTLWSKSSGEEIISSNSEQFLDSVENHPNSPSKYCLNVSKNNTGQCIANGLLIKKRNILYTPKTHWKNYEDSNFSPTASTDENKLIRSVSVSLDAKNKSTLLRKRYRHEKNVPASIITGHNSDMCIGLSNEEKYSEMDYQENSLQKFSDLFDRVDRIKEKKCLPDDFSNLKLNSTCNECDNQFNMTSHSWGTSTKNHKEMVEDKSTKTTNQNDCLKGLGHSIDSQTTLLDNSILGNNDNLNNSVNSVKNDVSHQYSLKQTKRNASPLNNELSNEIYMASTSKDFESIISFQMENLINQDYLPQNINVIDDVKDQISDSVYISSFDTQKNSSSNFFPNENCDALNSNHGHQNGTLSNVASCYSKEPSYSHSNSVHMAKFNQSNERMKADDYIKAKCNESVVNDVSISKSINKKKKKMEASSFLSNPSFSAFTKDNYNDYIVRTKDLKKKQDAIQYTNLTMKSPVYYRYSCNYDESCALCLNNRSNESCLKNSTKQESFFCPHIHSAVYKLPRSPTARAAIIHYPYPPVPPQFLPPLKHSHQQALFDEFVKIEPDVLRVQLGHFIIEYCTRSIPDECLRTELTPNPYIISEFVNQIIYAVEVFAEQAQNNVSSDTIPTDINEVYISKWLEQKKNLLKPLEILHRRRQKENSMATGTSLRNYKTKQEMEFNTNNSAINYFSSNNQELDDNLSPSISRLPFNSLSIPKHVNLYSSHTDNSFVNKEFPKNNDLALKEHFIDSPKPTRSQPKSTRRIGASLGEELDHLGVPRMIHYENLKFAIQNRGLVVQLPSNNNNNSHSSSNYPKYASKLNGVNDRIFNFNNKKKKTGGLHRVGQGKCSNSLFNLLIAGRGDTRRSRLELPWGDSVKIKYNRTLLGIPDFVVEGLGYGTYSKNHGTHHLIPKVCAVSLEDSLYGVEVLLFYRGLPCHKRFPSKHVPTNAQVKSIHLPKSSMVYDSNIKFNHSMHKIHLNQSFYEKNKSVIDPSNIGDNQSSTSLNQFNPNPDSIKNTENSCLPYALDNKRSFSGAQNFDALSEVYNTLLIDTPSSISVNAQSSSYNSNFINSSDSSLDNNMFFFEHSSNSISEKFIDNQPTIPEFSNEGLILSSNEINTKHSNPKLDIPLDFDSSYSESMKSVNNYNVDLLSRYRSSNCESVQSQSVFTLNAYECRNRFSWTNHENIEEKNQIQKDKHHLDESHENDIHNIEDNLIPNRIAVSDSDNFMAFFNGSKTSSINNDAFAENYSYDNLTEKKKSECNYNCHIGTMEKKDLETAQSRGDDTNFDTKYNADFSVKQWYDNDFFFMKEKYKQSNISSCDNLKCQNYNDLSLKNLSTINYFQSLPFDDTELSSCIHQDIQNRIIDANLSVCEHKYFTSELPHSNLLVKCNQSNPGPEKELNMLNERLYSQAFYQNFLSNFSNIPNPTNIHSQSDEILNNYSDLRVKDTLFNDSYNECKPQHKNLVNNSEFLVVPVDECQSLIESEPQSINKNYVHIPIVCPKPHISTPSNNSSQKYYDTKHELISIVPGNHFSDSVKIYSTTPFHVNVNNSNFCSQDMLSEDKTLSLNYTFPEPCAYNYTNLSRNVLMNSLSKRIIDYPYDEQTKVIEFKGVQSQDHLNTMQYTRSKITNKNNNSIADQDQEYKRCHLMVSCCTDRNVQIGYRNHLQCDKSLSLLNPQCYSNHVMNRHFSSHHRDQLLFKHKLQIQNQNQL